MFLRPITIAGIAILRSGLLTGCATGRRPQPRLLPTRLIGTITLVNEENRFVLIDANETAEPGLPLQAVTPGGEPAARLKVSPEKKAPFLIADIVSGTPHRGDQAITLPPAPQAATVPPAPSH